METWGDFCRFVIMKNTEKIILDIYREAYREATPSADFDELLSRGDGVNYNAYYLPQDKLKEIVERHLKHKRKYTRKIVEFNAYLGCSPTSIDFYYILEKTNLRFYRESSRVRWVEWNEDGTYKAHYDYPAVGRSLLMSPFDSNFTWMTTPITEILEPQEIAPHTCDTIHFKTQNSEYTLKKIHHEVKEINP